MFYAMAAFLAEVLQNLLLPLLQIYFCFSVSAALWGDSGVADAANLFARCFTFALKLCGMLFTFVLPQFFTMFEGQEIPAITAVFMAISKFMTNNWLLILLAILMLICILKGLKDNDRTGKKIDQIILSLPIFGKLFGKIVMGHFANAMSILYASGVTIVKALEISSGTVGNRYIAEKLVHVREKVEKGVALSQALQSEELFDKMFWSMVHIGEESGNLETMFFKLSEYLEQESEAAVQKMMAVLEPLILILIAVVIGCVVASVLLPIYSMYQV